jgi:hypothetical protein
VRTLADRYSLQDCVLDGPHWSYWRGYDGVLRRPVGILVLAADHPQESAVMAAARASAGAEDPRVLRVLDALTDDEGTCFVIEWLTADSLEEQLADGPLPDRDAWHTVLEVAQTLAAVEPQGLTHGALAPHWVLRGDDGRVRLLGLCIAGELSDRPADDGSACSADARGLGSLLYATLTGRWPGDPADCALPAAPSQSGHPVRPRMVRAGVPSDLDDITARALGLPGRGEPLATPAAVAAALELAGERMRGFDLGEPADLGDGTGFGGVIGGPGGGSGSRRGADADRRSRGSTDRRRRRRSVPLVVAAVVVALLAVPAYLGLRTLATGASPKPSPTAAGSPAPSPSSAQAPTGVSIPIAAVHDFDPKPAGNGSENPDLVKYAWDGNPATSWHTVTYFKRPDLGGLKGGVGLLVDLGEVTDVGAVSVNLVGIGTSLELRASSTLAPQADDYTPIAKADDAGTFVTLRPVATTKTRYLLIWLTSLPPSNGGYRGGIAEIQVFRS